MANREKGEIEVVVGGRPYTLVLDIHAIYELEELFDLALVEIAEKAERGRIKYIGGLFWAALRRYHKEMTQEQVRDWIAQAKMSNLMQQMQALVQAQAPDAEDLKEAGISTARPRKAQAR